MATAEPRLTEKNKDMAKSYDEILAAIEGVRTEVLPEANTAARVGGVLMDILEQYEGSSTTARALIKAEQDRALMAEQALRDGIKAEERQRSSEDVTLTNRLDIEGTGSMTLDEMLDFNPLSDDGKSYLAGYLDKPSRYVVTVKGNGTYDYPVNVGILEIISDSSQHIYTQKFTTHYVLNEGTFGGTHDDARLHTYYRSYSVDSPVLEPGWSAWQEKTVYKLESRLADVEKVTASLPSDIVGLSTIQSLLLSKVGNIVICEEEGFFVVDSEGHIGAMVTAEKSSGFGSDVEYIRQSDVEYN